MTGAIRRRLRGRTRLFVGSAVLAAVAVLMPVLPAGAAGKVLGGSRGAKWFSNPVLGPGQDPSVMSYGGWYYYTQSSPDTTYI
jgi:hypothetical protein